VIIHLYFDNKTNTPLCELHFDVNSYQGCGQANFPYYGEGDDTCEECASLNSAYIVFLNKRLYNARDMMKVLNIDYQDSGYVSITDLYDLLNDQKKMKDISTKLKMKLFW
jgi:hypothetical protein